MLILFDHGVPAPLLPYLIGHAVVRARGRGWERLSNGDLLAQAEQAGFEVFLTADKPIVRLHVARIAAEVNAATQAAMSKFRFRKSYAADGVG
jgi:hypothetical protein